MSGTFWRVVLICLASMILCGSIATPVSVSLDMPSDSGCPDRPPGSGVLKDGEEGTFSGYSCPGAPRGCLENAGG